MSIDHPSAQADAVSRRLAAVIDAEIVGAGGWIPFSRFMELALYAPGLGYYSAGAVKVGASASGGSDFTTAPELTPLFARALARPIAQVLAGGGDTVLELGGGSGRLAADLLLELEVLDALPASYLLLDVSADFRERQAAMLALHAPHLAGRVRWIESLPARVAGVAFGNEVLDALPVDVVVRTDDGWSVRGIERGADGWRYADRRPSPALMETIALSIPDPDRLPPGYLTEVHAATGALVASLTASLTDASALVFVDYGFPASEYFHPQRAAGTLMAHRRHRARHDLLAHPGLQDITAHVDFSAIARAALGAGGSVVGYTNQASFLIDCGIADLMAGSAADVARWAPQAAALQTLMSEAEMGELFKVIAIVRTPRELNGFGGSDRRGAL